MDNDKDWVGQLTKFWPYIFFVLSFFIHSPVIGRVDHLLKRTSGAPRPPCRQNQCFHIWSILSKVNLGHMQLIFIFHPFPSWSPHLTNSGNWVAMAMRKRVKKIFRKHKYFQYSKETTVLSSHPFTIFRLLYLSLSFLVPLVSDGGLFSAEISKALDRILQMSIVWNDWSAQDNRP